MNMGLNRISVNELSNILLDMLGIAFGFCTYIIATIASGKAKELKPLVWILFIVFLAYLIFGL